MKMKHFLLAGLLTAFMVEVYGMGWTGLAPGDQGKPGSMISRTWAQAPEPVKQAVESAAKSYPGADLILEKLTAIEKNGNGHSDLSGIANQLTELITENQQLKAENAELREAAYQPPTHPVVSGGIGATVLAISGLITWLGLDRRKLQRLYRISNEAMDSFIDLIVDDTTEAEKNAENPKDRECASRIKSKALEHKRCQRERA